MDDHSSGGGGTASSDTGRIDELVRIVNSHHGPVPSSPSPPPSTSSTTGSPRTYTPPLMGTSARASKRRVGGDTGPMRIDGTDTYSQQLQHHYQNVRQILDDQKTTETPTDDPSVESRQSFSAKRDYFEERFKTPPPTYDTPPRQQQKYVTKTITSNILDRTSSSSNESPSVDRVLEQAVELQKLSNNSVGKHSLEPVIVERTEEYQVFLDSANHEIRRTPSISHVNIVPITRTGHATDLDQAQAQADRLADDHQAIQHLTRALQGHTTSENTGEFTRIPQYSNTTTTTNTTLGNTTTSPSSPRSYPSSSQSGVLVDRTNLPTTTVTTSPTTTISSEFAVIDALLDNPLGTSNASHNNIMHERFTDIVSNIRNPEYANILKQPSATTKTKETKTKAKKEPKAKKSKEDSRKTSNESTTGTIEHAITTPITRASTQTRLPSTTRTTEYIPVTTTTVTTSEETPLVDPKEKKKQDKENKKAAKVKTKSKKQPDNLEYHAIDAIISSPIALRLPDSYLTKYRVSAPLTQLSPLRSLPPPTTTTTTTVVTTASKDNARTVPPQQLDNKAKDETLAGLGKVVHELMMHHTTALTASADRTPTTTSTVKESQRPSGTKQPTVLNETVRQQPLLEQHQQQQRETTARDVPFRGPTYYNQESIVIGDRPQSQSTKPRVVYRYLDEQGRLIKMSPTPPFEVREIERREPLLDQHQQSRTYRTTEPPYFYGRHIAVDDERRHPLPQHEERATWQGEPKLPTTVTREDFELRDRRVPQLSEQPIPASNMRTVPVLLEHDHPSRAPPNQTQQQRTYHYPNQQDVRLAWMPLSYQQEQSHLIGGGGGYDTDSTISERSATYRPYDYGPVDSHYRVSRPLLYSDHHYSTYPHRSPGPAHYPPPPPLPYGGRGISPEYGRSSSRNYIEVYRGGDFQDTKPSEVYSLPLNEPLHTSPVPSASSRHSRYDQYQSQKYGTMGQRNGAQYPHTYYSTSTPSSRHHQHIPTTYNTADRPPGTVYTSSYYTHRGPTHHRTVQSSPNPDYHQFDNYLRHSKSFDYRPLRTKLQREYKITPSLLVDEWDHPQQQTPSDNIKYSTTSTITTTNRSGVSSPDDVFISNRSNKGQP